ncbi:hypothetical protein B0H34DRAFT_793384 [Crassisporium funariophilum]|nr:hypothetical protein B0H34DRAFT_793384 [Crassisporium funariophilum]
MRKTTNVKSEGNWSIFRHDFAPGFEQLFDYGVNHGLYDVGDPLEKLVFRWLAIPWLQAEIDSWVIQRNFTAPRRDKNKILPQGMFFLDFSQYAPPDHKVFQLTPPAFATRAAKRYYEAMGRPAIGSTNFWVVYQELLHCFKTTASEQDDENLLPILEQLEHDTARIAKEEIPMLPGLKPLRLGAKVVGDGNDNSDSDGSIYVDMMTDEEEEEESSFNSEEEEESVHAHLTASQGSSDQYA